MEANKIEDPRMIPKNTKRFYKYGIELCDGKWPCYGGHTLWLARLLRIDYLSVGLQKKFLMSYEHSYYDGQHHSLDVGFIYIAWGGRPFMKYN